MRRKIRSLCTLFRRGRTFGFRLMMSYLMLLSVGRMLPRRLTARIAKWQQERIRSIIDAFMAESGYDNCDNGCPPKTSNTHGKIWFCWLQGEESMPKVPRLCLKSIRRYANGHEVIVLTLDNYRNYVSLPERVERLFSEGKMSAAHFSDCLRLNILRTNGGLWLDATMLMVRDIEDYVFELPFYSIRTPETGNYVSRCRWAVFCVATPAYGRLVGQIAHCVNQYWARWDCPVDYLFLDYIIDYLYEHDSTAKEAIDAVPYNNPNIHELKARLCDSYDKETIAKLCADNFMFKLNWRLFADDALDREGTVYRHFENILNNE